MEAVLDFLLMPLLGLVSAALCIGILFCLNHIANGGLRGNGGYAFEGLVNVPSSTLDTDAPRAELIRRRNMHKAQLQQQEDTGLFTPPFVPPAPYHPRRLSMMHIIKTPPSPSATFLPAISPSSPAPSALAQIQRWPLVAMRRAEARDSMEFVTTTSPNIPVLMQGGGRNVHSQAPGRVPSPSFNPVRATARTFSEEPSLQAIPQPLPASEVPSPGVVADDNNPPAAALDQHQTGAPPAPPPPAPEARVEVSTENASLAELIAVMARSKKLVISPVGNNVETRTPSRILLKRASDQSPMTRTPTTDPGSAKRRRVEGAEGAESETEDSQPRKRVHTPMPKDKAVPSSAQRKRKPESISSATRSQTPSSSSSKKPASQKSEPEAKKSRGAQQKSSPPTAVREDGEAPRRKKNILERVLAVYPPSLPPPAAATLVRYEESTMPMDAQQTSANVLMMASTPMVPPLPMGPPPSVVAMTMSSPVSPSLLLEQLSPRGGASADRPLSPRGRAPLASSSQERKDMLNGRKRRTVSFDEQQLLQVVQQEDERKRKLMRELEQEELADKKANKRVGKLLQAATPKKRVQINMEASVIKFDSFAPPSDSAAAKGKPEEQQKSGDLAGSGITNVTFDSSSTSLFASTNWEWDSPASSSDKKEPKPTKRREKRGRAGSDSSSPGSSTLVSTADLPSDMPLPILFSSNTSSSSSSRSTAASTGGSSVASFFSGDAASPFDSFLSSASSASSSASANDPFFSPTPAAAARDSSATTTSSDALASLFGPGAITNTSAAVAAAASPSRRRRSTSASESDAYSFLSPASSASASSSSAPSVSFNPGSLFGPSSTTPTSDSAKPADAGLGSIFGPPLSSTSSSSSSSTSSSASARGGFKPPLFREASSVSIFNDVPGKRTPLTKPSAARDQSLDSQRGQLMASSGSAFVNRSASPSPSRPSPSSSSSSSSSSFNPGSLFGPPSTSSSASAPGDIFSFSVAPSSGSSSIFDPTASSTSFEFPTEYRSGTGGGAEDQTPGDEDEEDQYDDDQEEEGEEEYDDEEEFPQPEEEESHNIVWYPPESTVPLEERVKSRPFNRQGGSQQYSGGDDGGGGGGGRGGRQQQQQQRGGRGGGGQGRGQGQGSWRGGGRGQPRGGASSRGGPPSSGGGGQARGGGSSGGGGGGRERRPRTDARTERGGGGGARGGSRGRGGGGQSRGGRGGGRGQGEGGGGGRGRATTSEACPW